MVHNPDYVLKYICGKPRLIACGQANANMASDLLLTQSGAFMWKKIEPGISIEELKEAFFEEYDCTTSEDKEEASNIVTKFVNSLEHHGLIYDPVGRYVTKELSIFSPDCKNEKTDNREYSIAGIKLILSGNSKVIPDNFSKFEVKENIYSSHNAETGNDETTLHVSLHECSFAKAEASRTFIRLSVNSEIEIYDSEELYLFYFPVAGNKIQLQMDKSGQNVHIFYETTDLSTIKQELFLSIGAIFFYIAQLNNKFCIHSASMIYRDRVWLFSAQSGVGKSTHVNLWKKNLGVQIFNGDQNLVTEKDGELFVSGIPWCGTSETFMTGEYPLGGIILLKQAPTDYVEELDAENKISGPLHRFVSPMWKKEMIDMNLSFAEKLAEKAFICRLNCTMNDSAMTVMREAIDKYLDK